MEEPTVCEPNLANNDENIELITGGIANDLVLNAENSEHSAAQRKEAVVNLPATTSRSINSVSCGDSNCVHMHHQKLLPLGYTLEPAPVKRVKFNEHGDTHEIEVESRGKVMIKYVNYESETQMKDIMSLITKDLSEPYSIYTYRYFIHNWPKLSFLVRRLINFIYWLTQQVSNCLFLEIPDALV